MKEQAKTNEGELKSAAAQSISFIFKLRDRVVTDRRDAAVRPGNRAVYCAAL